MFILVDKSWKMLNDKMSTTRTRNPYCQAKREGRIWRELKTSSRGSSTSQSDLKLGSWVSGTEWLEAVDLKDLVSSEHSDVRLLQILYIVTSYVKQAFLLSKASLGSTNDITNHKREKTFRMRRRPNFIIIAYVMQVALDLYVRTHWKTVLVELVYKVRVSTVTP